MTLKKVEKSQFVLDGLLITSLQAFYDEIERAQLTDGWWGRNLDALDEVLRNRLAEAEGDIEILWENHAASKKGLGYPETIRSLEDRLLRCHPANRGTIQRDLSNARRNLGLTLFDVIIELLANVDGSDSGKGGSVRLILK